MLPASGVPSAPRGTGLTFAKLRHRVREVEEEARGPGSQAGETLLRAGRPRLGGAGRPARLRGAGSARAPPHWACSEPGEHSRVQPHPFSLGPAPAPRPCFPHFLAPPPLGPASARFGSRVQVALPSRPGPAPLWPRPRASRPRPRPSRPRPRAPDVFGRRARSCSTWHPCALSSSWSAARATR